ncbi:MAG TPA: DNA-binding response regulator, partial [Bacilli bacterium]
MSFASAHEQLINHHLKGRVGESLRRLKKGHGHAEKLFLELVWWPAFGHFNYLFPEYKVSDFMDGFRYLDFAYMRGGFKVCIEIDAFGTHWRDVDRWQFADNLIRQNHLII